MKEFSTIPSCVVDTDRSLAALVRSIATACGELRDIQISGGACRFTALIPPVGVKSWESSIEAVNAIRKRNDRPRAERHKPTHKETCPTCGRK